MRLTRRLTVLGAVAFLCATTVNSLAQDAPAEEPPPAAEEANHPAGQVPYASQSDQEARLLTMLLTAEAWHYRCFGLLRLERFVGDEVEAHLLTALGDAHWQVRCFAIRAAVRKGVAIPEGQFAQEDEPRVIRMAQRAGVPIPIETVQQYAEREMRSRVPERIILGIEIAASSGDERLVAAAKRRTGQLLNGMDNTIHVTIGDRLAALLGIPPQSSADGWRQVLEQQGRNLQFPEFEPQNEAMIAEPIAPIAQFNTDQFTAIINYLDALHEQDLEVVVVIDGTGSMGHVIQRAQAQTNRLMLILNDLARSMRMGVVIYRDRGDRPGLQTQALDNDIMAVRRFLFQIEASGGGDFPEAIYEGLGAVYGMGWSRDANKQIIIVGDAPAHEENMDGIRGQASELGGNGIPVHTLVVGANAETVQCLEQIAEWGRGRSVTLEASQDLGKTVLHFAIEENMHESFDHFYDLYVKLCM